MNPLFSRSYYLIAMSVEVINGINHLRDLCRESTKKQFCCSLKKGKCSKGKYTYLLGSIEKFIRTSINGALLILLASGS